MTMRYRYDIDMVMRPTMVQLPEKLIGQLDARAIRDGASRSQVIREAVSRYLDDDYEGRAARTRAAYETAPFATTDAWGDMAGWLEEVRRARLDIG